MQDMKWLMVFLGICALRVRGQGGENTGIDDLSQLYTSLLEEEESDIKFPESNNPLSSEEPDLEDINWNETVDYLLNLTNNETRTKGRDEIPLKDIDEKFTRKLGFINLKGEFTADQGRLKGLSSVRRTGDVTVVKKGSSYTMTCPVGLETVKVKYDHYRLRITRGPGMSGSIDGEIASNSILVTATIDVTDTACTTTLDGVKIASLEGLKIRVHGLGALDVFMSRITTWLTEVFRDDIVRNLERALARELTKGLKRSKCERYASYFIFVDPK